MNVDGPALAAPVPLETHMREIRRAGAGSVRWAVNWSVLQPLAGAPIDFATTDRFVAAAARNGLRPLPVVMTAAPWAAENPYVAFSPPLDAAAFGAFARALAARYGTRGSFWSARPDLPRRPLRVWQIWNEPAGGTGFGSPTVFWNSDRDPLRTYIDMLEAAGRGLRSADPRAKVVLAGLFGESWVSLDQIYRAGARGAFDAVAIHPYTLKPRNLLRILRLVRGVMRRHGDARRPLVVTELSWPSAIGKVKGSQVGIVTVAQQGPLLRRGYRLLARNRKRLRLRGVFWYTWISRDESHISVFDHAGLNFVGAAQETVPKPALEFFKRTAAELVRR
jgi:hypothetical protein